jgi:hypothetical protein
LKGFTSAVTRHCYEIYLQLKSQQDYVSQVM